MSDKACKKCGGNDRYANGKCKTCADLRHKAYRAKLRGETPAVKVVQHIPADSKRKPTTDLAAALSTGKSRLKFMIQRNQETIESLEAETEMLNQRLKAAENSGTASDVRFFIGERRKLLEARMAYDARLSKDLQAYQELVGEDDAETPITFVHVGLPPREWVEVSCVGDDMDFSDYLPEKMGDAPSKPGN